jgi:predicted transcriptional regulator
MSYPSTSYSLDAELSVLGNLLYSDTEEMRNAVANLKSKDFYDKRNQKIFSAIRKMGNSHIDTITVCNHLQTYENVNYVDYILTEVFEKRTGSIKSTKYHAEIVRKKSLLRQVLDTGREMQELATANNDDIDNVIGLCTDKVESLRNAIMPPESKTFSFEELLTADLPEPEYILFPIIETFNEMIIHAKSGAGKTLFTTEIAYAVATGGSVLKWYAPKPRSVLLVDGEIPLTSLAKRYKDLQERNGGDTGNRFNILSFMSYEEPIDLTKPHWQALINKKIAELKVELLILDNLDSLFNLDQNKQVDWMPAQSWLKRLRANGISSIIVHHSNKQGGSFGTSALSRQPNVIIALIQPEGYDQEDGAVFDVKFEKGRELFASSASTFRCRLVDNQWVMEESPKSVKGVKAAILESIADGNTNYKDIASDLEKSQTNIKSLLSHLVKEGFVERAGRGEYRLTPNFHNFHNETNVHNFHNFQ